MNINITGTTSGSNNKGSSAKLVQYLEKENQHKFQHNKGSVSKLTGYLEKENFGKASSEKEWFFSQDKNQISALEVKEAIDKNKSGLKKTQAKYFLVNISPSQKELAWINHDPEKLKTYARSVMDAYARNFNRGITGDDLLYFGKVEYERRYKANSPEVLEGRARKGELKPGSHMHVHVVVSRKDRLNQKQFSPLTNHRNTQKGVVQGGFERKDFYREAEKRFEQLFGYSRSLQETFDYHNANAKEKYELERQAAKQRAQQLPNSLSNQLHNPLSQRPDKPSVQLEELERHWKQMEGQIDSQAERKGSADVPQTVRLKVKPILSHTPQTQKSVTPQVKGMQFSAMLRRLGRAATYPETISRRKKKSQEAAL